MICRLCGGSAVSFFKERNGEYSLCSSCRAVFLNHDFLPDPEEEKARYLNHNNDVADPRYQKFVSPVVDAVMENFSTRARGLDFGAGTGPVAADILGRKGYSVELYDPFFWNYPDKLKDKYDFIICSEVMEHFHYPGREFKLLRSLLNPKGALFCMTVLLSENEDFGKWHYRNDTTHVFFYKAKTIEWIFKNYNFAAFTIKERLISFYTDKPVG